MLTEHNKRGPPVCGGVCDGDKVDDLRGEVECDVVCSLDHSHCVMFVFLLCGDSPSKYQQWVLVRVQPLDLCYWHTVAVARICMEKNSCDDLYHRNVATLTTITRQRT